MSTELVPVQVCGAELEAGMVDGTVWVSVRRVCEVLDLAPNGQIEKLKGKPWAGGKLILSPSAGGTQDTFCLPLRSLPMWLATIEPGRSTSPDLEAKLQRFQLEAADVLADHFLGPRGGTPARLSSREVLADELRDAITEGNTAEARRLHTAIGVLLDPEPKPVRAPVVLSAPAHRPGWTSQAIAELVQAWAEACAMFFPQGMMAREAQQFACKSSAPEALRLRKALEPFTGLHIRSKAIGYAFRGLPEHFEGAGTAHGGALRWRVRLPA